MRERSPQGEKSQEADRSHHSGDVVNSLDAPYAIKIKEVFDEDDLVDMYKDSFADNMNLESP